MSLINQMLQDLDKRSADGASGAVMQEHVRAVPVREKSRKSLMVLVLAMLLAVGAGLWFWMHPERSSAPLTVSVVATVKATGVAVQPQQQRSLVLKSEKKLVARPAVMHPPEILPVEHNEAATVAPQPVKPEKIATPSTSGNLRQTKSGDAAVTAMETSDAEVETRPMPMSRSTPKPLVLSGNQSAPSSVNKQMKELTTQQRAENEYRKSVALMQQGRVSEAIAGLEQTLQLDAAHVAARQTLAGLLIESKQSDEAMRRLQDGLNLDPGQVSMAMVLARLQVEKGDAHSAVETLQRSLPAAAERADYQSFLAALLQREGRHKEAIEHYLIAIRKLPQSGVWWMGLGISLQAEKRVADATEAFNRAKATNTLAPDLLAFVDQRLKQLQH